MNKGELKKLETTVTNDLGLDLSKYRDEEVAENLLDLLLFPKYVLKWLLIPIVIALFLWVAGFFVIDLRHVQFLIYGVLGLVLFVSVGFFAGFVILGRQLGDDLTSVSDYSLGIMKNAVIDIDGIGDKINRNNRKEVMGTLFKGVVFLVTIPMLKRAIDKKIPVAKGAVKRLITGSLAVLAGKMTFDSVNIEKDEIKVDGEDQLFLNYTKSVDKASSNIASIIEKVLQIATSPFRIGLYITGAFLILLLYLIW